MIKDFDRDYGLPESEPQEPPTAKPAPAEMREHGCPNCGCKELMMIEVAVDQPLLKSGSGKGTYLGCPACPYASPMMIIGI
jgi:hypothetical protein